MKILVFFCFSPLVLVHRGIPAPHPTQWMAKCDCGGRWIMWRVVFGAGDQLWLYCGVLPCLWSKCNHRETGPETGQNTHTHTNTPMQTYTNKCIYSCTHAEPVTNCLCKDWRETKQDIGVKATLFDLIKWIWTNSDVERPAAAEHNVWLSCKQPDFGSLLDHVSRHAGSSLIFSLNLIRAAALLMEAGDKAFNSLRTPGQTHNLVPARWIWIKISKQRLQCFFFFFFLHCVPKVSLPLCRQMVPWTMTQWRFQERL